ncbi:MAG: TetR/AcrR family transcriptional regulator [Pseudomonadota bacterium]
MAESEKPDGRRGYHHGNLREALVEATRALIRDKGVAGFTFAEAARRAGVSPAAPYRHFQNREELIAEIARQGFERFAMRLEAAWDRGRPSPLSAFEAVSRAYLAFAREEPDHYAAMFEARLAPEHSASISESGHRAFDVLRQACLRLTAHLPEAERPPAHMMAYHVWSMAHGTAALFATPDAGRRSPIPAEDLLESGITIYLRGLGLIPPP